MFFKKKEKVSGVAPHQITLENFNELVIKTDKIVLIDFWAGWCAPCKVMNPIMEELAAEYSGRAIIGKINVEQQVQLAQQFEVRSIPTVIFIHKGLIVEHFNGVAPKPNLVKILDQYCD